MFYVNKTNITIKCFHFVYFDVAFPFISGLTLLVPGVLLHAIMSEYLYLTAKTPNIHQSEKPLTPAILSLILTPSDLSVMLFL